MTIFIREVLLSIVLIQIVLQSNTFCVQATDPTSAPSYSSLLDAAQVLSGVSYTDYESNVDTFDEIWISAACAAINWMVSTDAISITDVSSISTEARGGDDSSLSVGYTIDPSDATGYASISEAESAISSLLIEAVESGNFTAKLLKKAKTYDATFMYNATTSSVTITTIFSTLAPTPSSVSRSPTHSPTHKPTHSPTLNEAEDIALVTFGSIVGVVLIIFLILPFVTSYLWSAPKLEHPLAEGDSETSSLLGRRREQTLFGLGGPSGSPTPNLTKYSVAIKRPDGLEEPNLEANKSDGNEQT